MENKEAECQPSETEKEILENVNVLGADRELTPEEKERCAVKVGEQLPWKGAWWKVKAVTLRSVVLEPMHAVRKREKGKRKRRGF